MRNFNKKGAATAAAAVAAGMLSLYSPDFDKGLSRWEGEGQNTVYADRLAHGLPTVCRGLTKHTVKDMPIIVGDYWSEEKCAEVEAEVTKGGQMEVASCLPFDTPQSVFDAFSLFGHNVGSPNVCASRAAREAWAGDWMASCRAIAYAEDGRPVWSSVKQKDGTYKFIQGVHNRRVWESNLCRSGLN